MNEKEALKIIGALIEDLDSISITVSSGRLLLLQSGLVLASQVVSAQKHKDMHRSFADRVQAALKTLYPYDFTRPMTRKDLREAQKTEADLTLTVTYRDLYMGVGALQLMTRYQEAMPVVFQIATLGYELQDLIGAKHPKASIILNMGWDSRNDR